MESRAIDSSARVVDLEQPRYPGAPSFEAHEPGFNLFLHRHHERPGGDGEARTSASAIIVTSEHNGTHIDALCHQAEGGLLCDGTPVDAAIQSGRGISHLDCAAIAPIVCRGVLIDVAGLVAGDGAARADMPEPGDGVPELIGPELIEAALARQRTVLEPGDAVLVRTGNGANYADRERYERGPGISAAVSAWIAQRKPALVGADNLAWDLPGHVDPELNTTLPGHMHLICRAGIYIVENLALEELAEACAGAGGSGAYEFTFICLPLKMRGATGSPVRPIAIL